MLRYSNFAPHHGSALWSAYFTTPQPNRLNRLYHQPAHAILLRQRVTHKGGTGISTSCPSPTTFVLGLGPDLPWADEPSPGNLGLSTGRFLACLSLLIPAFSLLCRPPVLTIWLQPTYYAPLPLVFLNTAIRCFRPCRTSGEFLPLTFIGRNSRDVTTLVLPPDDSVQEHEPEASVVCFSPVTSSAHNHSTSELLRTL